MNKLWIEGSINLPVSLTEDDFNEKFLEFLEQNGFEFCGITEEIDNDR